MCPTHSCNLQTKRRPWRLALMQCWTLCGHCWARAPGRGKSGLVSKGSSAHDCVFGAKVCGSRLGFRVLDSPSSALGYAPEIRGRSCCSEPTEAKTLLNLLHCRHSEACHPEAVTDRAPAGCVKLLCGEHAACNPQWTTSPK